eukprot:g3382.t1
MECIHGFAYDWEYSTGERTVVDTIVPATGSKMRCYVSLDEKSMRLWDKTREYNICRWDRDNFIRAILPIPPLRVFVAAALDMTFKVYDSSLSRIGQFNVKAGKEDVRAVLTLHYDENNNEILTGGLSGCQRWRLVGDRFRGFRMNLLQTLPRSEGKWIDRMTIATVSKLLFCCHNNNVSVYRFEELSRQEQTFDSNLIGGGSGDGEGQGASAGSTPELGANLSSRNASRKASIVKIVRNIHEHKITGCVFQEANSYLITSSLGFEIRVLSAASSFALVHTFVGHSKAITALLHHPRDGLIVSASVDCTLRVWNLDTLEEEYHLQMSEPIHGAVVGWSKSTVLTMTPSKVVTWRLHHIVNLFALCRSPVVRLKYEPLGVVVAVSRDHSARVLDPEGRCLCTLLPDSAVSQMVNIVHAPGVLIGLLGSGEVFAYATTRTTASIKYRFGTNESINDIALCKALVVGKHRNSGKCTDGSNDGTSFDDNKFYLLCATAKGRMLIVDTDTAEQCSSLTVHKDAISRIFTCGDEMVVCIVPTEGIIVLGRDMAPIRSVSLHDTPFYDGRNIVPLSCVHPISTGDRALLFLGLSSGLFDVVDLNTGDVLLSGDTQDTLYEHDDRVCAADFFETVNGDMLIATGGDDGRLKVWIKMWSLSHNQDGVTDTDDDTNVASSFELLSELPLTSRVKALSFLPNGDILFGEGDHVSRIRKRDLWLGAYVSARKRTAEKVELKAFEAQAMRKQCVLPHEGQDKFSDSFKTKEMRHLQM